MIKLKQLQKQFRKLEKYIVMLVLLICIDKRETTSKAISDTCKIYHYACLVYMYIDKIETTSKANFDTCKIYHCLCLSCLYVLIKLGCCNYVK